MSSPAAPPTELAGPTPVRGTSPPAPGSFPEGFLWGSGTAAYQVEGSVGTDVAGDHHHRLDDDLDLLSWLGVGACRFSISWSRWMPTGQGSVAPRGADFYDRLVDGLLARGIQPWATLYHGDLPQALQDAGGWAERDTAHRFAEYAASVTRHLGDRVRGFFTLDDPFSAAFLGYAAGIHAAGIHAEGIHAEGIHAEGVQDGAAAVRAVHHLLLGHGEAMTALRLHGTAAALGIALTVSPVEPLTHSEEDREVARRIDGLANRLVLDPLLYGDYPIDVVADLSQLTDFSHLRDGDLQVISTPMDALGVTYRGRHVVTATGLPTTGLPTTGLPTTGLPTTGLGTEVAPQGLPDVLFRLVSDYDCPPLYLTEAGTASAAPRIDDDRITGCDDIRMAYLEGHLRASLEVITEGVDLRGYFVWPLMDNFEWDLGYTQRLGIFSVDRDTGRRAPKQSAHYLRGVIENNALRQR